MKISRILMIGLLLVFGVGSGALAVPVEIDTVQELIDVANDLDGDYILTGDIDLDGDAWTSIGTVGDKFTGKFDGDGYTISKLKKINPAVQDGVGLFGWCDGAEILNVTIDGVQVRGDENVGALIGHMVNTSVTNCHSKKLQAGDKVECQNQWGGGLIGHAHPGSSVIGCTSDVDVDGGSSFPSGEKLGGLLGNHHGTLLRDSDASGDITNCWEFCGGLVGYSQLDTINTPAEDTIIRLCEASGDVHSQRDGRAGGLLGYGESGTEVDRCRATGAVLCDYVGGGRCGGAIGYIDDGVITKTKATGAVTCDSTGGSQCGGLLGYADGTTTVTLSYATGAVSTDGQYGGGLVGYSNSSGAITECWASGAVNCDERACAGLVGYKQTPGADDSLIADCYATGDVQSTGDTGFTGHLSCILGGSAYDSQITDCLGLCDDLSAENDGNVGGIVGTAIYVDGFIATSYWDTGLTGESEVCGYTANNCVQGTDYDNFTQGITSSTDPDDIYEGWDFTNTWEFVGEATYPTLQNNPEP